ncbi:uncharacterized protein G2W53_035047 [Senna tora]|uniref:Uncharacterized protein n=1 Tax=Senna tora TaxID=362788 RepID=A0A834T2Y4_9FABA|nr:uncharacterized protein G2W53_035047 [Senna tora]
MVTVRNNLTTGVVKNRSTTGEIGHLT